MMPEVALQQIHKPHEIVLFTFGFQDSVSLIYSVEMVAHPKDKCGEQVRHDFLIPIFPSASSVNMEMIRLYKRLIIPISSFDNCMSGWLHTDK